MAAADVALSCIAYRVGDRAEVASLPLPVADRVRLLGPEGGLEHHRVAAQSCLDLALASARETMELARSEAPERRLDAVVVASNSLAREQPLAWIARLSAALEAGSPAFYFVNGGDCLNFQLAARLCHGLVSASPSAAVLFVTVDRVADVCPGQYLAVHGAGINSDAAASCLFSSRTSRGFRLGGAFAYAQDTSLLAAAPSNVFAQTMFLVKSVFRQIYEAHQLRPTDLGQVLTNTHTNAVAEIVALAGRLPLERVYRGNIPVTAHCFAADNLINLHAYAATHTESNQPLLLVGSGVHQWGGFLIRRCDGARPNPGEHWP